MLSNVKLPVQSLIWAVVIAITLVGSVAGLRPASAAAVGDPQRGMQEARDDRCAECHLPNGQGGASRGSDAVWVRLAGLLPGYIIKEVLDYRSGKRSNDQMAIVSRSLDDAELQDIAAYFAGLPPVIPQADSTSIGSRLYHQGDEARHIPACGSCHDEGAPERAGVLHAPRLIGQERTYLTEQMQAWRSGERHNGPDATMNTIARALSDAEVQSLIDTLAAPLGASR